MVNLNKEIETEIEEIIAKYQKEETKLLNYLIVDDNITFFMSLSSDENITKEDLDKIAELVKGEYISTESINQEYRIKFKYGL